MSGLDCDVLVVGAGPAGTAAASVLARAGRRVRLVDQHSFPREKVCGDGLIPDALRALDALGLAEAVRRRMRVTPAIRAYSPDRTQVDVEVEAACLPRIELDRLLFENAVARGAEPVLEARLTRFIEDADGVAGAVFESDRSGREIAIRARLTLLATGAYSHPLALAGLLERKRPSGFAVRAYYEFADHALIGDHLVISFDDAMCPGYGWIFPMPDGTLNIGAGSFHVEERTMNVRTLFERFVAAFPAARRIVTEGRPVSPLRGAPLRTGLEGARFGRPGLLAIGEAAGTTFALSGEGIGKAMETGMLAARLAAAALEDGKLWSRLVDDYTAAIDAQYRPRYRAYTIAQEWLARPAVVNFLAARARSSAVIRQRLRGVLHEDLSPREVFSLSGLAKSMLFSLAGRRR